MINKEKCKLDIKNILLPRVVNIWNKLPTDCVNATSVNLKQNTQMSSQNRACLTVYITHSRQTGKRAS